MNLKKNIMEEKVNKKIILGTIFIIITIIGGTTTYKVIKKHHSNMLLVSSKYIEEKARDCYNDKKCLTNEITLEMLYSNNYLVKQVNPITKEYYNEKSYVLKEDSNYTFKIID